MTDYWYNLRSGEVEEGAQSSWKHLLGPYATREEALKAMEKVQANNERWDEDEAEEDSLLDSFTAEDDDAR
ncbi:SPOR domain-containing protein [Nesterenkonia massiliensis]|uniref:SPOR domain-containing protein n=2 Tax=Nesterenkonia TaxID=57494 RepID=A0ABP9G2G2_9MICC|nr:SPOR domain-containing protein [Nesterenkonia massiliensis]MCT1607308.1 SPOR domain-containing protein [Nesterenkonia massiliensis]